MQAPAHRPFNATHKIVHKGLWHSTWGYICKLLLLLNMLLLPLSSLLLLLLPLLRLQLDLATRTSQSRTADGWLQFTIPMRDFDCREPALMNQLLWEAKPSTSSGFGMCLDEVSINRPGAAAPAAGPPASG